MYSNDLIIQNLLQQPANNDRIEIKKSDTLDSIAKTITAFINGRGGDLLLGIDENKKTVGVENVLQQVREIDDYLTKNIRPIAPISIQPIVYENKNLILISVWEGANKPYSYDWNIYHHDMELSQSMVADSAGMLSLIEDRKIADTNWERMPMLASEMEDLDVHEIRKTMQEAVSRNPNKQFDNEEDFLIQMGLLRNGNYTNACIVLFGKNPTKFIPQSRIRLTVYPDKKSTNTFWEDKWFEGNILGNITAIFGYLDAMFGKTIRIDGLVRTEKENYPKIALREGILNAIVHRDYYSARGFMQISIYTDRTEISNYGGLPEGITVADLKKEHSSILRNPDIAQICFMRGYIEMIGSGSIRILSECKKNGFKTPKWKNADNSVTLTFPEVIVSKNEAANFKSGSVNFKSGSVNGSVNLHQSNETEKNIMNVISHNERINILKISELSDIPYRTVARHVKKLKEKGYIEFVGADKTGGYQIVKTI